MRFIAAFASLAGLASATVLGVNANADVAVGSLVDVDAKVSLSINNAKALYEGWECPHEMTYSPWAKSCNCFPGQWLNLNNKTCTGEKLTGPWPKPDVTVYASVNIQLGAFCAASPYKIVPYDEKHEWCQAGHFTVVFLADIAIALELIAGVEIDVNANISAELKNVCAALSGLYLESPVDAVVAFNTDILGLAVVEADIEASLGLGLLNIIKNLTCKLGLGKCNYDCVAYCTKGCPNYIDVVGELGGRLTGLVGFCILPKVILVVNSLKVVVNVVVDSLLCLVGGLIKTVLSTFDCHCK
uniref:Secreted protein n=1 Tax=Photinus pyralis TaxID=7054 RepID=A0A1Y1LYW0_PHOPY